jgi:hypothetical protein
MNSLTTSASLSYLNGHERVRARSCTVEATSEASRISWLTIPHGITAVNLMCRALGLLVSLVASVATCYGATVTPNVKVGGSSNAARPIGSNYLYIGDTSKAIKYLNGGSISGTIPNLTGVTAIAANVQQTFTPISGSLSGSGATKTMTIGIPFYMTVPIGEHIRFTGMTPSSWNGSFTVSNSTEGTVTVVNPKATGTFGGGGLFAWNNSSIPATLHSKGIASLDFVGGDCEDGHCRGRMSYQASVGVDDIMVDEPGSGQSGWNTVISYWQSVRPGGGFGMTTGDETGALQLGYLNPPFNLVLNYAELEYYVGGGDSNPFIVDGVAANHPNVESIALLYGTTALCANSAGEWLSQFNTVGFWDVDNYGLLANTSYMDYNWLQNAQIYIESGPTSICNLAASFFGHATPSGTHQTGSFTVTTADNVQSRLSPLTIKSCQYSVYAGANLAYGLDDPSAVQTVPWTTKPCNGATGTITVGPTGNCNVNSIHDVSPSNLGNKTFVCAVAYRALMSNSSFGDENYSLFQIN